MSNPFTSAIAFIKQKMKKEPTASELEAERQKRAAEYAARRAQWEDDGNDNTQRIFERNRKP